jgi:hypothetical protein
MIFTFVWALTVPAPAVAVDFLVPGVSLESVTFTRGARVRYLVTSEVHGAIDSSMVELAVLDSGTADVLLEILSASVPVLEEETVTVRLRLERTVTSISSPDEFRDCIREILVRDGTDPFREPSDEEAADFELERVLLRQDTAAARRNLECETIETAAGTFYCEVTELSRRDQRAVKLGGIDAERIEEEVSTIWMSRDVPFWGMVKSRVERRRETVLLTDSPLARLVPQATITSSILVSFESGAAP